MLPSERGRNGKKSLVTYTSSDDSVALVCAISREYERNGYTAFWFAFHPHQREVLERAEQAFIGFGCGSAEKIVLIPFGEFRGWLDGLNRTTTEDGRTYWHVHIHIPDEGHKFTLRRKKDADDIDVTGYALGESRLRGDQREGRRSGE